MSFNHVSLLLFNYCLCMTKQRVKHESIYNIISFICTKILRETELAEIQLDGR